MTTTLRRLARRSLPGVAVAVLTAGVVSGTLAAAHSTTSDLAIGSEVSGASTAPAPVSVSRVGSAQGIYSHGMYSVQLAVNNDTDQTMTFQDAKSEVGGGHWATRPTATIAKGGSDIITAYTDQPSGFSWNVTWQLDNGDYATVYLKSGQTGDANPHLMSVGVGSGWDDMFNTYDTADPAFSASLANSGGAHSWVTVGFQPATS